MSFASASARARFTSTSTISRPTPFITSAKADAEPTIPQPTIPIFMRWPLPFERALRRRRLLVEVHRRFALADALGDEHVAFFAPFGAAFDLDQVVPFEKRRPCASRYQPGPRSTRTGAPSLG